MTSPRLCNLPYCLAFCNCDTITLCSEVGGDVGREDSTAMSIALGLIGKDGIVLATDSRVVSRNPDGSGQTHDDNAVKLWNIKGKIGIAGVGNIAGYESRIVQLFQSQANATEYEQLVEDFRACIVEDWAKAIKATPKFVLNQSPVDFILAGYHEDIPTIKRIFWEFKEQAFVIRNIEQCYYVTGMWSIAEYWLKKFRQSLPLWGMQKLLKVAIFLICESNYFDSVGGRIQILTTQKDIGAQTIEPTIASQLEQQVRNNKIGSFLDELHKR